MLNRSPDHEEQANEKSKNSPSTVLGQLISGAKARCPWFEELTGEHNYNGFNLRFLGNFAKFSKIFQKTCNNYAG